MRAFRGQAATYVAVLMVLFAQSANAQLIMPGTNQSHIDFANQTPIFDSVLWGAAYNQTGGTIAAATYTCIRNDDQGSVFLTGGHHTALSSNSNFSLFRLTNRPDISVPTAPIVNAASWGTHPQYNGVPGSAFDVGYVTFPPGLFPGVTPAQFPTTPTPLVEGERLRFAGYGPMQEYGGTGTGPSGVKRAGETLVDFTAGGIAHTDFLQAISLPLVAGVTPGYTGAGAFDDAGFYRGLFTTSTGGNLFGTVSDANQFQVWASGITPVPEPTSFLLVASPAVYFVVNRYRRNKRKEVTRAA